MNAISTTGGFGRWIVSMVVIALLLAGTFLAVTAFFPGETYADRLAAAYETIWKNTSRRQFTDIMRSEPWLYVLPAGGLVLVLGWQLPRRYWGRAILTYLVFFIGFVGGHVFW